MTARSPRTRSGARGRGLPAMLERAGYTVVRAPP